ncbi:hypothetical protein KAJ27_23730, partial [bacterium]|nr:hypothetical protein [bacterium]
DPEKTDNNQSEDSNDDENNGKKQQDSTIQIDILPIVDPVRGINADKLKVDDRIIVKIKNKNLDITAPVFRILPATMRDRLFITVMIADDTFGNMIIPKNLKLKTDSVDKPNAFDNYLFYVYLVAGLILFLLTIVLVYIIF